MSFGFYSAVCDDAGVVNDEAMILFLRSFTQKGALFSIFGLRVLHTYRTTLSLLQSKGQISKHNVTA